MNMNIHKWILGLGAAIMAFSLASCSDFDDINVDPSAAGAEYMHPDYALNKSIYEAQMDPDIAERVFVYNWCSIARYMGDNTFGASGRYSNEYNDRLYSYTANWVKYATNAIELADTNPGSNEHEQAFFPNVKQFARIWRCMLIADFTDSFGPYPLDGFQGENPTFNSVEEVYDFLLSELADAAANIDLTVVPTTSEAAGDPAFGYNGAQWQKLANSLRLRYAMRLSEVAPAKAQSAFEAAASQPLLTGSIDSDLFGFQENGGWSCWEGVVNRSWSDHTISASMCNLLSGLGGVPVVSQRADLEPYVKPMTYIGEEYKDHFPVTTDNPMKQMWMDGLPEILDPRALVVWNLPNDPDAENYPSQASQTVAGHASHGMYNTDGETFRVTLDAQFCWNGYPSGVRTAWCPDTFRYNNVLSYCWDTTPFLGVQFRNNTLKRIWFAPWETYFLLAEGAVRGWNAGTSAKDAYESGVKSSFEYHGVSQYADQYLASTSYNRVGTSASFDHTAEPENFTADYKDGYTKEALTKTYEYPDPSKILYKGGKLNDQLTKIITQKYLANVPYGVVEAWNDRRRLGLPFFEIAGNETTLTGSDMEGLYSTDSWQTGQVWQHFVQRMRYSTAFESADAEEYQHALELLGATTNTMMTPLWWAIGD